MPVYAIVCECVNAVRICIYSVYSIGGGSINYI